MCTYCAKHSDHQNLPNIMLANITHYMVVKSGVRQYHRLNILVTDCLFFN